MFGAWFVSVFLFPITSIWIAQKNKQTNKNKTKTKQNTKEFKLKKYKRNGGFFDDIVSQKLA